MATDIKQSARNFSELWIPAKDSEVGGKYPDSSLADLYDPLTMPTDLVKAHAYLDTLVDKAYGLKPDTPEPEIVAHLFKLYAEKTKP